MVDISNIWDDEPDPWGVPLSEGSGMSGILLGVPETWTMGLASHRPIHRGPHLRAIWLVDEDVVAMCTRDVEALSGPRPPPIPAAMPRESAVAAGIACAALLRARLAPADAAALVRAFLR
eukprot:717770-Pyramimonas_sp.AAC.1